MNDLDTRDTGGVTPGFARGESVSGQGPAAAPQPLGWVEHVKKDRRRAFLWTVGVIVACLLAGGIVAALAAASPSPGTSSGHAAVVGSGGEAALLSAALNAAGTAGVGGTVSGSLMSRETSPASHPALTRMGAYGA